MIARIAIAILALYSPCFAADFPVSDQDQSNIAFLCETAARSPNLPIEQVVTAAQFCVQWKARVKAAGEAKQEPKIEQSK